MEDAQILEEVQRAAQSLEGRSTDYDPLIEAAADKDVVLIGESTHGTHEFYAARAYVTQRLIDERGFDAVAVEADWPDAYRINRFVRGLSREAAPFDCLSDFRRFPEWMWRNTDTLRFVSWLQRYNSDRALANRVGFYGLDLYSLNSSLRAVVDYLGRVDPAAARRASGAYDCFSQYGGEPQAYGHAVAIGLGKDCEDEVVTQLAHLREEKHQYLAHDGFVAEEEHFCAEQNARLALSAEQYYREMYRGDVSSWNLRDSHMTETLLGLHGHLANQHERPRIVVWAHNSHLGDARHTSMSSRGEHNVGQLVRERFGERSLLVGQTTFDGEVLAATNWDGPAYRKTVLPARADSWEMVLHRVGLPSFLLETAAAPSLRATRRERAIGVIYRPETELMSHYFRASLSRQFDYILHFDRTRPLEPLEPVRAPAHPRAPETYPSGV